MLKISDLKNKIMHEDSYRRKLAVSQSLDLYSKQLKPPHILFTGAAGTGKTTYSKVYGGKIMTNCPTALKIVCHQFLGESLQAEDFEYLLRDKRNMNVIFVDEVHNVKNRVLEHFYNYMEERKVLGLRNKMVDGGESHVIIGATTDKHLLPGPFITRFRLCFDIPNCGIFESASIMLENATERKISITEEASELITDIVWGVPRKIKHILECLYSIVGSQDKQVIEENDVRYLMCSQGIYPKGLLKEDIEYMELLRDQFVPVALLTISTMIGKHRDYIMQHIEARLFPLGFIEKTSRGRRLTPEGVDYLEQVVDNWKDVFVYGQ